MLRLIDRFPVIVWLGGGLLGWIAGGLVTTDGFMVKHFPGISDWHYPMAAAGAVLVLALGWIFVQRFKKAQANKPAHVVHQQSETSEMK